MRQEYGSFLNNRSKPIRIWEKPTPSETQPQPALPNKTEDRVNPGPALNYEKMKQPTAAEKEILEWLKADGCEVKDLGHPMGYRIFWTMGPYPLEFRKTTDGYSLTTDGYSLEHAGQDESGNYLYVRKYDYTWRPLMRLLDHGDLGDSNPVSLAEIKRRRIKSKNLR